MTGSAGKPVIKVMNDHIWFAMDNTICILNGVYVVIEVCSRNKVDQIAVNVRFVGKRRHLRKLAE